MRSRATTTFSDSFLAMKSLTMSIPQEPQPGSRPLPEIWRLISPSNALVQSQSDTLQQMSLRTVSHSLNTSTVGMHLSELISMPSTTMPGVETLHTRIFLYGSGAKIVNLDMINELPISRITLSLYSSVNTVAISYNPVHSLKSAQSVILPRDLNWHKTLNRWPQSSQVG